MDDLGLLRRVDPAVVDDDPFWSVVRQRHPDVTLVLLPEEPPPPDAAAAEPADPDDIRRALDAVREVWAAVVQPLVVAQGVPDPPRERWREGPGGRAPALQKSLVGIGQAAGEDVLRGLVAGLARRGWRLGPGARRGMSTLRATDGALVLDAVAGPGATVLTLAGASWR